MSHSRRDRLFAKLKWGSKKDEDLGASSSARGEPVSSAGSRSETKAHTQLQSQPPPVNQVQHDEVEQNARGEKTAAEAEAAQVEVGKASSAKDLSAQKSQAATIKAPPPTNEANLWDQAYNQLSKDKPKLINKYERLLSEPILAQASLSSSAEPAAEDPDDDGPTNLIKADPAARRSQMESIIEFCQNRPKNKIRDAVSEAASVLVYFKDWIDKGVQASPEASMVWAGVSMVLPLLTNAKTQLDEQAEAFTYVTSRISYYTKLEGVFFAGVPASDLKGKMQEDFVEMYQSMLEVQILSVLRISSSVKTFLKDSLGLGNWKASMGVIKEKEERINNGVSTVNMTTVRDILAELKGIEASTNSAITAMSEAVPRILEIQTEQLMLTQKAAERELTEREMRCLRVFAPDATTGGKSYLDFKASVVNATPGTCQWFCKQDMFQSWLDGSSGLLLVTAGPGCGKSVLAKYIIDHVLPASDTTVCYFFFHEKGQRSLLQALCALIHQLLSRHHDLIRHASTAFEEHGESLVDSFQLLWGILRVAAADDSAGNVVLVIDALDECDPADLETFVSLLRDLIGTDQGRKVRFFLTGKPSDAVDALYDELEELGPSVKVPGNEHSEEIGQEINLVAQERLRALVRKKKRQMTPAAVKVLEEKLVRMQADPERTYLWLHSFFDYLEHLPGGKFTAKELEKELDNSPKSVEDAYIKLLKKAPYPELRRKVFCILLAVQRLLTVRELQEAVEVADDITTLEDMDLEETEGAFLDRLSECCGFLITLRQDRVTFFHTSVPRFLERCDIQDGDPEANLSHITPMESHAAMARSCIQFLLLEEFQSAAATFKSELARVVSAMSRFHTYPHPYDDDEYNQFTEQTVVGSLVPMDDHPLYEYASLNWDLHVREADDADIEMGPGCLALCDMSGPGPWSWLFRDCYKHHSHRAKMPFDLITATYMPGGNPGDWGVLDFEPRKLDVLHIPGNTQLWLDAFVGFRRAVTRDLDGGCDVNEGLRYHEQAITPAAVNGHKSVVDLLVARGGRASLSVIDTIIPGSEIKLAALAKLFLKSLDPDSREDIRDDMMCKVDYVQLARSVSQLSIPPDLEAAYSDSNTALMARSYGKEVIKAFIDAGANIHAHGPDGRTLLHTQAISAETAELLLSLGVDPKAQDNDGRTSLYYVGSSVEKAQLLVRYGAKLQAVDNDGSTPLHKCNSSQEIVQYLLEQGADPNARDNEGATPFMAHACSDIPHTILSESDYSSDIVRVLKLLQTHGADMKATYNNGSTLLHNPEICLDVMQFLLEQGADPNARDREGITPFMAHACPDSSSYVPFSEALDKLKLLQTHGAGIQATDNNGSTALHNPKIHPEIMQYLLEQGADPNARDSKGRTPIMEQAINLKAVASIMSDNFGLLVAFRADLFVAADDGQTVWDSIPDDEKFFSICWQVARNRIAKRRPSVSSASSRLSYVSDYSFRRPEEEFELDEQPRRASIA